MKSLGFRAVVVAMAAFIFTGEDLSWAAGRVFFDGGESGNFDQWSQTDFRDKCKSVAAPFDSGLGPRTGSRMISCNTNGLVAWNVHDSYETGNIYLNFNSEMFTRTWLRRDADHFLQTPYGSPRKLHRFNGRDGTSVAGTDVIFGGMTYEAVTFSGLVNGNQFPTYWGDGNQAYVTDSWHKVEMYVKQESSPGAGNGILRFWVDGIQRVNMTSLNFGDGGKPAYFNITSNWSDCQNNAGPANPCGANNHVYFDDIEVYTDVGTGASGSMSDATIKTGGASSTTLPAPPKGLKIK